MKNFIGILSVIVFWVGVYFLGNTILGSFSEPFFPNQLYATLYGIIGFFVIGIIFGVSCGIYWIVMTILDEIKNQSISS